MAIATSGGRINQKARTERAIIDACLALIRQRQSVTMPDVARAAMVSEATAYRYFPDIASLISRALADDWPTPELALEPVARSDDPMERVAFATRILLQGVADRQAVVRAMIATTIARPDFAGRARPGIRFGLIDYALSPFVATLEATNPDACTQLRQDLAIVVSADALFCLTDLCGLSVPDAIASAVHTARTLTAAAFG
jgi:AcrR family transcriptional regulator